MASGRMEFHVQSIMQHANFCYVLPNDVEMPEVVDKRHYERKTKSLILLHGLTGTDSDWLFGGVAQEMAIQYNLAVFMPTCGNFFYLDRGYKGGNYATFVGEEFPDYVNKVFGYCGSREDTLIGGLSMGGYGAIHTALCFPERFCDCMGLSSALRIRDIAKGGEEGPMSRALLRDVFGDPEKLLGSEKDPEALYRKRKAEGRPLPRFYLACGTEDSLLEANRDYRDFLKKEGADVCWEEGPGGHNWRFWNQYIDRGLRHFLG
ncbi:MAG: acetylesterase [Oscillospiraceae bacterium]|nr:acetylesterase [Oscillospiraceae bacterium]